MALKNYLFTSESVTEGHPDKMADQISDAILDAILEQDPHGRVACETLIKTGLIVLAGEISARASVNYHHIARKVVTQIGYDHSDKGFDGNTCGILMAIEGQSADIAQGVDTSMGIVQEQGAGDQGLMFGFACNETPDLMPMPIYYAHKLVQQLAKVRHQKILNFLRPDGKSQVTVRYEHDQPVSIETIVLSSQHHPDISYQNLREALIEEVIKPIIPSKLLSPKVQYHINPTGRFVIGGPMGDSGLTGRKIIVDTYGGMGRHGGGAFSGKDPSKVDRSASYMARYIAKNIVASGLAQKAEVQLAYAIGMAEPISVLIDTFGTASVDENIIAQRVKEIFPLKPAGIIQHLDLLRPIYQPTASYGHFGRSDGDFPWEKTDLADALKG